MRKLPILAASAALSVTLFAGAASAGGPPAVGFYVDGDLYRTIGTPTDLSGTGAPLHSFDTIYALGEASSTSPSRSRATRTTTVAAGWSGRSAGSRCPRS
jgi:hypothetical protein